MQAVLHCAVSGLKMFKYIRNQNEALIFLLSFMLKINNGLFVHDSTSTEEHLQIKRTKYANLK
jgi:hypothetical protein